MVEVLRTGAAIGFALTAASIAFDARADERHPLRNIRDDSLDLIMSVKWDWTRAPAGQGDRAYFEQALRTFADKTYNATEGRLRVCKVHVYKAPRYFRKADIVVEDDGRANAALGAIRLPMGSIESFRRFDGAARSADELGVTLAHELGHYALFLKDEYDERLRAEPLPYQSPRSCDVTLPTLMGSKGVDDFSLPKDYEVVSYKAWSPGPGLSGELTQQAKYRDCTKLRRPGDDAPLENAMFRTAQWRTYRMSAWELITGGPRRERLAAEARDPAPVATFPSIAGPGMPDRIRDPRFDGACFQTVFHEGAFAVLLIDRSSSMSKPTGIGSTTLLDKAKAAAKAYVASAPVGTTVAVVEFASTVATLAAPTRIDSDATRATLTATIDAIAAPVGNTGLDAAMSRGMELILKGADIGNYQYLVAITDGEVVASDWLLATLKGLSIPVFAHGVGGYATGDVLTPVARRTGGEYSPRPWEHGMIEALLDHQEPLGTRLYGRPKASEPIEQDAFISELDGSTTFRASWSSADKATLELVAPDGKTINPAALPTGVSYEQHPSGAAYVVTAPSIGRYRVRLVPASIPTSDVTIDVSSNSSLRLEVEVRGSGVYPEPFFVRARVGSPKPILGAAVTGLLRLGASGTPITLRDDGVVPDETADDGVYTAALTSLRTDGKYTLDIRAENPGGARVDPKGVVDEPGAPEAPMPLSKFVRESSHTVEGKAFREMPESAAGALSVRNDFTPLWIAVDRAGGAVWLKFNGYKNGRYVAMTGDLLPASDQPLKSKLSLYAPDGTTLIAESAEPDGRGFVSLATPRDADGVYFLKIEGSAPGRLRVAVAPEDWFKNEAANGNGGGEGSSGCDCRAGARAGSPWMLVLGLLLAIRRYARR